jgi:hypothetical protein
MGPDNIGNYVADDEKEEIQPEVQPVEQEETSFSWLQILKTKTGPGPVEDYVDNPFNFNRSMGLAQILRGLSGFLGALDYAIVDIVVGSVRLRGAFNGNSAAVK